MRLFTFIIWVLFSGQAFAHEMTPIYPKLNHSFTQGILQTQVQIFNRREDIEYYELGVFDNEWNPIPFATEYKIVKISYLERKTISIYIRERDRGRASYICSLSKIKKENVTSTSISSRICSKIK